MGMQIIHYVCLLPIKGEHKIKYGAEAEERLLLFSRVLSSNLNLGSGGGPSPSTPPGYFFTFVPHIMMKTIFFFI